MSRVNYARAVMLLDNAQRDMGASIDAKEILAAIKALDSALDENPENKYVQSQVPKLRTELQALLTRIY